MATLFGGPKLTPEQTEELRKKRQEYLDYLSTQQTNTNADVSKKTLTPESGDAILKIIKAAQDWMAKNPNADLNTVLAEREKTSTEISRVVATDVPKRTMNNLVTMLPIYAKEAEQKQIIKSDVVPKLEAVAKQTKSWYDKNKDKATSIEFNQEVAKFDKGVTDAIVDQKGIEYINSKLNSVRNLDPEGLRKVQQENQKYIQKTEDETIDVNKGVKQVMSTATKTFFGFLLVTFLIMCGSFAANLAIGRPPAYRVLYFLWGAIPFFAPLVLLYTIYRRIKEGRLPMYAILPVSIEPASTRLGRFFWYPFYYVPDVEQATLYKQFQETLQAAASP